MPIPLRGDRSAWDTTYYSNLHARDIEYATYTKHLPPGTEGKILRFGTSGWEAADSPVRQWIFPFAGQVTSGSMPIEIYNLTGYTQRIHKVFLSTPLGFGPTGQDLIVDVFADSTSIFTSGSNKPRIIDGEITGYTVNIDIPDVPDGSRFSVSIDQYGSIANGSNLTVHVLSRDTS